MSKITDKTVEELAPNLDPEQTSRIQTVQLMIEKTCVICIIAKYAIGVHLAYVNPCNNIATSSFQYCPLI